MFEVKFFPIYGVALGVNYWDSTMDIENDDVDETVHMLQIFTLIFGFSIIWYTYK